MRAPGIRNGSQTEKFFAFVADHIRRTGRQPRPRDIADHMGWKSTSGVADTYLRLVTQKRLMRVTGSAYSGLKFEYKLCGER